LKGSGSKRTEGFDPHHYGSGIGIAGRGEYAALCSTRRVCQRQLRGDTVREDLGSASFLLSPPDIPHRHRRVRVSIVR
jgi:hypothetical protein